MKKIVPAFVTALAVVLSVPAAAVGQVATQDSVTGSGGGGFASVDSFGFQIDAHSGPSGEAPTGTAAFSAEFGTLQGPVTCLAVKGNVATVNLVGQGGLFGGAHVITFTVTDSPAGDRLAKAVDVRAPADCSPLSFFADLITFGDIVVVDALPLPSSKDQCKIGGWRTYRVFKNQGDCVRFVRHQARQQCIFIRARHGQPAFQRFFGAGVQKRHAMRRCIQARSAG